jgi:pimeloyl-ACP methyl ester carboxylesterase
MPGMRTLRIAVVVCLATAGLGSVSVARSDPTRASATAGSDLGQCPRHVRPRRLRCGTIVVPFERADPSLGTIPITYAVREPGNRTRPALGTIFAVEGGPGYGSISSSRYYIHLLGPLLERRRLVLVDMRGTGHSRAIDCPALQSGRGTDLHGIAQCARILGPTYGSYRTSAAADDLDAVRERLGLDRISMYGDSYGTFLAQSYAYRHGDHLESLVLDSAYPVRGESAWYPSLWRNGIRSLYVTCRRAGRCDPGARGRLERMVELLRSTPRGVGPLLDQIAVAGNSPPHLYLRINDVISDYLAGDRRPYRRLTAPYQGDGGSGRAYSYGDELTVSCNDYPMLWDKGASQAERRRQLEAQIRNYPRDRFQPFTPREIAIESTAGYRECLAWPRPSPLYQPPAPAGASAPGVPTLVVSGELDDATSPTEGRMVAADFPNSRFMLVHDAGHVSSLYGGRYPSRDRVREFLIRHG